MATPWSIATRENVSSANTLAGPLEHECGLESVSHVLVKVKASLGGILCN